MKFIIVFLVFPLPLSITASQDKTKVGETVTLNGKIEWSTKGGGFYALTGATGSPYVLRGDRKLLQNFRNGDQVEVKGRIGGKDTWGTILDFESIKLIKSDSVSQFQWPNPNPWQYNPYPYYNPSPYYDPFKPWPYYSPSPYYLPNPYYDPFKPWPYYNPSPYYLPNPYYYPLPKFDPYYNPYPKFDPYYKPSPKSPTNPLPYYPSPLPYVPFKGN